MSSQLGLLLTPICQVFLLYSYVPLLRPAPRALIHTPQVQLGTAQAHPHGAGHPQVLQAPCSHWPTHIRWRCSLYRPCKGSLIPARSFTGAYLAPRGLNPAAAGATCVSTPVDPPNCYSISWTFPSFRRSRTAITSPRCGSRSLPIKLFCLSAPALNLLYESHL